MPGAMHESIYHRSLDFKKRLDHITMEFIQINHMYTDQLGKKRVTNKRSREGRSDTELLWSAGSSRGVSVWGAGAVVASTNLAGRS
ncbi:hypothetical protein L596_004703 [Steinernema carpocapsae]|uniref:Uncharacterized protein n=1 Tax=Steinernema carpocapsae TaxID=34508 RepID=A0A4U8V0S9_STECR|nr:hypothetical protein L596_004703 [Steinernema carpocapsae]